jgi:hypothetical protein
MGWDSPIVMPQPGLVAGLSGAEEADFARTDRLTDRPALFTDWNSPIAMPQPRFGARLSEARLAEEADFAKTDRPTDPSLRAVRKHVTPPLESPAERGEHPGGFAPPIFAGRSAASEQPDVAPAPHADHRNFASLSYPRAKEKVTLTGPVAAAFAGRGAILTAVDQIDFAEQLRVALTDDARRHGIEV